MEFNLIFVCYFLFNLYQHIEGQVQLPPFKSLKVTEGQSVNYTVGIIPVTNGKANITYSIISGKTEYFKVVGNDTHLEVQVNSNELDYERMGKFISFSPTAYAAKFHLVVEAVVSASNKATMSIEINVENDNQCSFKTQYVEIYLWEKQSQDVTVYQAKLAVPYFLSKITIDTQGSDQEAINIFELNGLYSGILWFKPGAMWDSESGNTTTTIKLKCDTHPGPSTYDESSFITITLHKIDINDNSNVFNQSSYNFNQDENKGVGYAIGTVLAKDADQTAANSGTHYYILGEQFSSDFSLNSTTGLIVSKVNLDYEQSHSYALTICATDNATSPYQVIPTSSIRTACVPVTITLNDVNDNDPSFLQYSPAILVSEKFPVGQNIYNFIATDKDAGVNGQIEYKSVSMNSTLFSLDTATGVVKLIYDLDYEETINHTIVIYAEDKGTPARKSKNVTLTINVNDVNDNNPVFMKQVYQYNVTEDFHGFLDTITATDSDAVKNKLMYYLIDPSNSGVLTVDGASGNVSINANKLDREKVGKHEFLIVATDKAKDERTGSAVIVLNVNDVNDNDPKISPMNYDVTISQYAPLMTSIFDFDGKDDDITSVVTFAKADPSYDGWKKFSLNTTNGDVMVIGGVNAGNDTYTLDVYATDGKRNSSKSTLTVHINRKDQLHFATNLYHFTVPEGSSFPLTLSINLVYGNFLTVVQPTNIKVPVKYYLVPDNQNRSEPFFRVDENSGEIYLKQELDFEKERQFSFLVNAVDTTGRYINATTLVVVDVEDQLDVPPTLHTACLNTGLTCKNERFNLTENPAMGEVVAVLYVIDSDTETATTKEGITYTIHNSVPFQILRATNPKTAYIVVSKPALIDREQVAEYKFNVSAKDRADLTSNLVEVTITIIDTNDNNPIFTKPNGYVFDVIETDELVTDVGVVQANDLDFSSPYNTIAYSLMGESPSIIINKTTGEIKINSTVDYEIVKHFEFIVIASDASSPDTYQRKTAVPVRIDVSDVNDNPPVFSGPYNFSVNEDALISSKVFIVRATDADSGQHGLFKFSSAVTSPFRVEPSGEVILTKSLDYEIQQKYTFNVVVNDTGGLYSMQNFTVYVTNVDDNRPTFTQPHGYSRSIPEDTSPSTNAPLLKVTAIDNDLHTFNQVTYSIMNPFKDIQPSGDFPFQINASSGEIMLSHHIDREKRDFYQFVVKATDDGIPVLTNVVFVNITITDVNDNNPKFSKEWYYITMSDATNVGGTVGVVSASDADAGMNGEIMYSLSDTSGHFAIDNKTGAIYVANHLYVNIKSKYVLELLAIDGGVPTRNDTAKVDITILRSAMKNYPTTISEIIISEEKATNGSKLNLSNMAMKDVPYKHTYSIEFIKQSDSSSYFRINSTDGCVYLTKDLDFEKMKEYIFKRKAIVNNSVIGEETVFVNILDVNDNHPYFFPKSISQMVNISEDSEIGQIVAVFQGSDPDEIDRSKLDFSVPPVEGYSFGQTTINGTLVLFLTGELDAEMSQKVVLNVFLSDGKNIVQTNLTINIIDENDNSPIFESTEYVFNKDEGATPSNHVGGVVATDKDVTNLRKDISYKILDSDVKDVFEIYPNGTIVCKKPLDHESMEKYEFTVEAFNTDTNKSRSAVTLVTVNVIDVNDNPPVVHGSTSYKFYENEPLGSILFTVNATDEDAGENSRLSYNIVATGGMPITVNSITGTVRLVGPIDFEASKSHEVDIMVSDNGKPAKTTTKTYYISVMDVNDNSPTFNIKPLLKYVKSISENTTTGSSVIQTFALDSDSTENARVSYSLYEAFDDLPFNISSHGLIYTTDSLDREKRDMYQFFIIATDHGTPPLSDTILVEIIVTDVNDNNPIFKQVSYNISLAEGTPQGFSVLQVTATDQDSGDYGHVIYTIINQTDNGLFTLNKDTGFLYTSKTLKQAPASYVITITAQDKDPNNPRSSLVPVIVNIKVLPSFPSFNQGYYNYSVPETEAIGYFVGEVLATGLPNLRYYISTNGLLLSTNGLFSINDVSGKITTAAVLNIEEVSQHHFTVVAMEKDSIRNVHAPVVVTVTPKNEYGPMFISPSIYHISESITTPSAFIRLHAVDHDKVYNKITYSLVNSTDPNVVFTVNSTTGLVTYNTGFDFENAKVVTVTFMAQDNGVPSKETYHVVQVILANINEHNPRFEIRGNGKNVYFAEKSESLPSGSSIIEVKATDNDSGLAGEIEYSFAATQESPFTIDKVSGLISLGPNKKLDYEKKKYYELLVIATDKGAAPRSDAIVVQIQVTDINDNLPIFDPHIYHLSISDNTPVGRSLCAVFATDADSAPNDNIAYLFPNGNSPTHFGINSTSGEIYVTKEIDYRNVNERSFVFSVLASDGNGRLSLVPATVYVDVIKSDFPQPPYFNQEQYIMSVVEDQPQTRLLMVSGVNPTGDPLIFSLVNNTVIPDEDSFSVSRTGSLFLSKSLDYEKQTRHVFLLKTQCSISGLSGYASFTVRVIDVNDNTPYFEAPTTKTVSINEKSMIGQEVTRIFVKDADSINQNDLFLRINTPNVPFKLVNGGDYGTIYVNGDLEKSSQSIYLLEITVFDKSPNDQLKHEASQKYYLTVNVTRNDKRHPQFDKPSYAYLIQENNQVPSFVGRVINTNSDPLSLVNANGRFSINENGEIYAQKSFNAEIQTSYEFIVIAKNPANNFTTLAPVVVTIQDVNDFTPQFEGPFVYNVSENKPSGSFLFYVDIKDDDVTFNTKSFRIKSTSPSVGVSIHSQSGYVYLTGNLDYETSTRHKIEVEVEDGALLNTQVFTINVINENDNNPIFNEKEMSVSIEEFVTSSHLLTISATDKDAGIYGQIKYRIQSFYPNAPFAVSKTSGRLFIQGAVDYENIKQYNLLGFAEDGGSPPRVDVTRIQVNVLDSNDNQPKFDSVIYNATISEVAPIGTSLIQVHATDIDSDKFNVVNYQLINTTLFRIDSKTGIVYTKASLNYEASSYHELTVTAADALQPSQSPSEAVIKIFVLDVNEDQPSFATPVKYIDVLENASPNTRIGSVQAVDTDSTFKTITYSAQKSDDYSSFSIVSNTGEIKLAAPLDSETKKLLKFTVIARDNGGLEGRQTVIVNVIDVNDNPPQFINLVNQTYTVSTEIPAGQTIAMLNAYDPDSLDQGKLTMDVVNQNSPFEITTNKDVGYLSLKQGFNLDQGLHVVEVSVTDGLLTSNQNAYISITVRHPTGVQVQFRKIYGYEFNVSENVQNHIFGSVNAVVKDNLAPVSYRIWESDFPFKINSSTGVLSQNGEYNFEARKEYFFHVVADVSYDGVLYSAVTSVFVKVNDVNDNKPVFTGISIVSIPEDILVGKQFLTVTATDSDAPNTDNSRLQFSMTGTDKLAIDPSTGALSVIQALDYELENTYQIKVTAFDRGVPAQSAERAYTINVLDVNDNRPTFKIPTVKASVRENIGTQTQITCNEATDDDTGDNGSVQYELLSAEEGNTKLFTSSRSGCIFYIGATGALDRETKSTYEFILKATDKGSPSLVGLVPVVIEVLDINDNAPLFANSVYNFQLSDATPSGSEIIRLTASDPDDGPNGQVTYSIIAGNLANSFRILSDGQLETARVLNLNSTLDKFSLTIKAEDNAAEIERRSSTMTVNINIIVSDAFIDPKFTKSSYSVNITEAQQTGVVILTVQAILANTTISYELLDCSVKTAGKIQINSNGQISLLQQLNYEELHMVSFYVKAYDASRPNNGYSIALVMIYISDVNDERPVFQRARYQISLARNSKVGTLIANVVANDADSGNNGFVRYEFEGNSLNTNLFSVNSVTGDVTLKRALTKSDVRNFQMKVRAYDLGSPRLTSSIPATISINVYPDNMFRPVIINGEALKSIVISENAAIDTLVATIQAKDEDADLTADALAERPTAQNFGKVSYILLPGQQAVPFTVTTSNGQIRLTDLLDREAKASYEFYVEVRDGGSPYRSTTTRVYITISDFNEPPSFQPSQYSVTVSEATPRGVSLISVTAIDKDLGANGELTYSIIDGNIGNKFDIVNSGVISLIDTLDYESVTSYTLKVRATDGKLTTSRDATVLVTVANANEGQTTPVFELSHYSYKRSENTGVINLATIRATAVGASVSYTIANSSDSSFFSITTNGGVLSFNGGDFEVKKKYSAFIVATSSSDPKLMTYANVMVELTDVNDNTPTIMNPSDTVSVKEDADVSSLVYTVYATDLDSGVNGALTFSFVTPSNVFEIQTKRNTGKITLKAPLNRESTGSYTLRIRVSDNGSPQRQAQQVLTVTVLDQNDNNPLPVNGQTSATIDIAQTTVVNSEVYTVRYNDNDIGVNGQVEYVLATDNQYFAVASNGVVTLKSELPINGGEFLVYVNVRDKGTPSRQSPFTLLVKVSSTQQGGKPSFSPVSYTFQASEGIKANSIIGHLNVIDTDFFEDSYTYTIRSGDANNVFKVLNNGNVQVLQSLDRETISKYTLSVSVTDKVNNVSPLDATVVVEVTDVNDNVPTFTTQPPYSFNVKENSPIGNAINGPYLYTVEATDKDEGLNGIVSYSITDTTQTFGINEQGRIYLLQSLDYDRKDQYDIFIIARDQGTPRRATTIPVTIAVLDINDPPIFQPSTYTTTISESAPTGVSVITLNVVDNDKGPLNNQVSLSIRAGNDENKFRIQDRTIFLANSLNFETTRTYTLSISARDNGNPSLSAIQLATVTINIANTNDNQPKFVIGRYTGSVNENTVPPEPIVTVSASDKDGSAAITYSLDNSQDAQSFKIVTEDGKGKISPTVGLNYESQKQYTFNVLANDNQGESLSTRALVIINVNDVNDNIPIFQSGVYNYTIDDESPIGSIVGKILATDEDSGTNAVIEYSFAPGSTVNDFELKDNYLILKNKLDFTKTRRYVFNLRARDKDSGKFATEDAQVTVNVKVNNGNAPVFTKQFYNVTVLYNITVSDIIATVNAIDNDGAGFSKITYTLLNTDDSKYFRIDGDNGQIKLKVGQSLSTRQQIKHVLVVNAIDNAGLSSQTYVIINVIGVSFNGEVPIFIVNKYFGVALDRMDVGASIVTVYAVTAGTKTVKLTYQLESGNTDDLFLMSENGALQLKKTFVYDPNRPTTYTLSVSATNTNSNVKSTQNAVVIVTLHYLNPDSPIFNETQYSGTIDENSDPKSILTVEASFGNANVQGELRYRILYVTGDVTSADFIINSNGVISSVRKFNRETKASYVFLVETYNSAQPSSNDKAVVTITVNDVNDNAPSFGIPSGLIQVSLIENAPIDTEVVCVKATDSDTGLNGQIEYFMETGGDLFEVGQSNGVVTTKKLMDYETADKVTIRVGARDKGTPQQSDTIRIAVTLINVNDVRPEFAQSQYLITIDETNTNIDDVVTLQVKEPVSFGPIKYQIVTSDPNLPFVIDQSTGVIATNQPIDFEKKEKYELCVMAYNSGNPFLSTMTSVTIDVNDVNDNAPIASTEAYVIKVSEAAPIGSLVAVIKVTDADSGNSGQIVYSISSGSDDDFRIDAATGEVTVRRALDYESKQQYVLTVQARDNAQPAANQKQLAKPITVTIDLVNVNDNSPVVSIASSLSVVEGQAGLVVAGSQITVTDKDKDDNVQLSLANHNDAFEINQNQIQTKVSLNYDVQRKYELVIKATDSGNRIGISMVTITVSNQNNKPIFPSNVVYNITIPEDQPINSIIAVYTATDQDSGSNGLITYRIDTDSSNGKFSYDNGILRLLSNLDFESTATYNLKLTAQDNGSPKLSSTQDVTINVENINDNAPVFLPEKYVKTADATGSVSIQLSATDTDDDVIRYSIVKNAVSSMFTVSETGLVTNTLPLSKSRESYYFNVQASDSVHVSLAQVLVNINGSQCTSGNHSGSIVMDKDVYTFAVDENFNISSSLFTVAATTTGSVGNVQYIIEDINSKFMVETNSGKVYARSPFDFEKNEEYTVCIVARSSLNSAILDSSTIRIQINDVNDVSPVFTSTLSVYSVLSTQTKMPFASIVATTPGKFSIVYSILMGNNESFFSIEPNTGDLRLVKSPSVASNFTLAIRAKSGNNSNEVKIIVEVIVPDSPPSFTSSLYTRTLPETRDTGVSITAVSATSDNNVIYDIVDSDESFTVDQTTGVITNTRSLDFETARQYMFCVRAKDTKSGLINVAKIIINLSDVNDEPPNYTGNFTLTVSSAWPIGVGLLDAVTSEGIGVNYSFSQPAEGFEIHPQFATITLTNSKPTGTYLLTVKAQNDFGTAVTHVSITLTSAGFATAQLQDIRSKRSGQLDVTISVSEFFTEPIPLGSKVDVYVQAVESNSDDVHQVQTYQEAQNSPGGTWLAIKHIPVNNAGSRKRRAVQTLQFTLGTQANCLSTTDPRIPCNMPLPPGKKFRIYLRVEKPDGEVVYSAFSQPTDPSVFKPKTPQVQSSMKSLKDKSALNYNYIAALIVMATIIVICVAAIAILLCQKSREHKKAYFDDYIDAPRPVSSTGVARTHVNLTYDEESDESYSTRKEHAGEPNYTNNDSPMVSRNYKQDGDVNLGISSFFMQEDISRPKRPEEEDQEVSMEIGQGASSTSQQYILKHPTGDDDDDDIRPPSTTQPRLTRTASGRVTLQHDFGQ